jgi:hypothetical protein
VGPNGVKKRGRITGVSSTGEVVTSETINHNDQYVLSGEVVSWDRIQPATKSEPVLERLEDIVNGTPIDRSPDRANRIDDSFAEHRGQPKGDVARSHARCVF